MKVEKDRNHQTNREEMYGQRVCSDKGAAYGMTVSFTERNRTGAGCILPA
jgi:hypothetical protein